MAVLPSGRLLAGEHRAEQSRGKPSRAECSEQQKWPVCRSARTLLITLNLSSLPINITLIIPSSNKPGYLVFLPMAHTRKGWGESARGRHTVHSKKWQCPSSSKEGNGGTVTISISSAVLAAWEQRKSLHGEKQPSPTSAGLEASDTLSITIVYVMNTSMNYQEKRSQEEHAGVLII